MNQNTSDNRPRITKEDRKRIMAEEGAILAFTEEMLRRMDELRISKSALAEKLNVEPAFVSKLISGENNFTIKTMAKIALSLQSRIELSLTPLKAQVNWAMADVGKFEFGPIIPTIAEPVYQRTQVSFYQEYAQQYTNVVRMDTAPIIAFHETVHSEATLSR